MLGTSAVTDADQSPGLGDVNFNQVRDNGDAQLILNFFAAKPVHQSFEPGRADLDRNGLIDNGDAQESLNFFGHAEPALPVRTGE